MIFLLQLSKDCICCIEEERIALLQLKASWSPTSESLLSWVDEKQSDCCEWNQVKCDNITNRVIQITLNGRQVSFPNASLFLPFEQLQLLDLTNCNIYEWLHNQGFERLRGLKKLENLILERNQFNESVLPSLGAITSLRFLDLGYNQLDGSQSSQGYHGLSTLKNLEVLKLIGNNFNNSVIPSLGALTSLKTLDLSENRLEGSLPELSEVLKNLSNLEVLGLSSNLLDGFLSFHGVMNTSKLKFLDLSENNFSVRIPPTVFSFKSLEALYLRKANISGSLSGFCELKNLLDLDLRENKFGGIIPLCLSNLTSLRMLDLSDNQLSGNILPPFLFDLNSLEYISLSQNQFQGTFFLTSFIEPKFQLKFLALSNSNLNTSTSDLFKLFHNQYDLRHVDISHNNLHGTFPTWLVENNTWLQNLLLGNNSLSGPIHFVLNRGANLNSIDISNNHIQGQIQTNVGDILSNLKYLNLSQNGFEGIIPPSLGNMKNLTVLDLSSNNFSGKLPESLALGCKTLMVLILSNNRLHGQIYPAFYNLTYMFTLRLNNNQFTGRIQNDNVSFVTLFTLDIGDNRISGRIPSWVANLTTLQTLILRNNSFDGPIPPELCRLDTVKFFDLSQNHLTGSIPFCLLNLTNTKYLHLQGNKLTGTIPETSPRWSDLVTLDLKDNNLSGNVPNWIGSYPRLRVLLLKGNSLGGPLPHELCRLEKITIMDLSHNRLSGSVPPCFSNITFGQTEAVELLYEDELWFTVPTYNYTDLMGNLITFSFSFLNAYTEREEVEFMTKSRSGSYKGDILTFMSGLDLSSNLFTGGIPHEIGALTSVRALNFSHNQFIGEIPKSLSNLKQLESMDLSYNKLTGDIPSELTEINTLAVFTVAYNNLSGRVPDMKAQFSTFSENVYEGNPFLCGPPLQKQCNTIEDSPTMEHGLSDKFGIDRRSFLASFAATYFVCLLGLVVVLYINSNWRQMWFSFIEKRLSFVFPHSPKPRRK
ncbi:hypothetical protein ACHQM5_030357 [Ranunculus cassubicifolius]